MASKGSVADVQEEDSAISGMSFEESATVPGDVIDPQQTGQQIVQDPPPPVYEQQLLPVSFSQEASCSLEASFLQPSEQVPTINGGYNGATTGRYIAPPPYTTTPSIPAQESVGVDPVNRFEDLADEITELRTDNSELNERLKRKTEEATDLRKRLSNVTAEKTVTEQQLEYMNEKFERVEKEKNEEIERLKSSIEGKERHIEKLKNEKAEQEQYIEAEITKLQNDIDKLNIEKDEELHSHTQEKHKLELQLSKCETNEETLKKEIAEAEKEALLYKAELSDEKRRQAEEKQKQTKEELEQTKEKLLKRRRSSELKDQAITQLEQRVKQLSHVPDDKCADPTPSP